MSLRASYGLARSLAMYYAVPGQAARMARLYAGFVRPGALCFDVGAHVGNRVRAFARLGARVVAVEPHPGCLRVLRALYGRDPAVALVPAAVGARAGSATLRIPSSAPTMSSVAPDWVAGLARAPRFAGVRWDATVVVPVTTLDALIARHGAPAFCKLDVEGSELAALQGLSRPVRALSFEYIPAAPAAWRACVARVAELGRYEFNWSSGESMRLREPAWRSAAALTAALATLGPGANSGDVYARLSRRD